jgi:predicted aspartyl protease
MTTPVRFLSLFLILLAAPVVAADTSEAPTRPGPPPGNYTITPDADSIRIPFEMFRGDIRMNSRVNGKEARMLIDNGSLWDQLLFFGSERVDALGLEREGKIEVAGPGTGPTSVSDVAEGIEVSFEGVDGRTITFHDQVGIITPYEPGKPNPWWGSEGQVSAQFFTHFIVEMDFDEGIITLTKPEKFRAKGKGKEIPISPMPGSPSWSIPGSITLHDGRKLDLDFTMDLGWDEPVGITTGQAHDIQVPAGLTREPLGIAAQGQIFGYRGTVPVLEIGGHRFRDVLTTYSSLEDGGSPDDEILVGMGIFRRFRLVYDYSGHRIFLKPNKSFRDPFESPAEREKEQPPAQAGAGS